ncbi:inositol monophosphatase family protein [Amaricoccus sp.]|uniref:inositol monophosphatase family protein n=1 Tax=Amaricoccus sp. TaxID=1872485 RepID=UPI002623DF08|nr:inositol monophosphatase family protein [uncultured Amaricoccus sp.]
MQLSPEAVEALWLTAEALADVAAARSLPLFRTPGLRAANKAALGFDPVTQADRDAEAAMRTYLRFNRPADGVLGEEFGPTPGTSGLTWVLDPIDGTRAFISGATTWGTLIAVDAGLGPVLGLIDQPYVGERFMGGLGRATMIRAGEERPLRVRACAGLADAVLYSTFPEVGTAAERAGFEAVRDRVQLTRYGTDCYGYALIALGQVDLVIEAGLKAYDIQGPQGVIEAAGGLVTDWRGRPAHLGGRVLAAGDARVHAAALELLSQVAD